MEHQLSLDMIDTKNGTSALTWMKKERHAIEVAVGQVVLHIIGNMRFYHGVNYLQQNVLCCEY